MPRMHWFPRRLVVGSVAVLAVAALAGAVANGAFAQGTPVQGEARTAAVYAGGCDALGAAAFPLNDVRVQDDDGRAPSGDPVGSVAAVVVEVSDTQLNGVRTDALLSQVHSVAVSDASGIVLACGEIGGYLYENEDLYVGLLGQGGSGMTGVAIVEGDNDDNEVDVNIYLVPVAGA